MSTRNVGNKWVYVVAWSLISIIIMTASYAFVWYTFYKDTIFSPFFLRGNWMMVFLYCLSLYVFTGFLKGYKIGISRVIELIYSQCMAIFLTNVFAYLQIVLIRYYFFIPTHLVLMTLVQIIIMSVWVYIGNKVFYSIFPPKSLLVITKSGSPAIVDIKMNLQHKKYKVAGFLKPQGLQISEIKQEILKYDAVVLSETDNELQNLLVPLCYENGKNFYFYPSPTNIILSAAEQKNIMDTPVLLCKNQGPSGGVLFFKKCTDVILSLILLVLTSPLMLLTAILIKIQDGGKVFFKQERLTKDGKTFNLYKFRSMIVDAEADGIARLAKNNDSRITPIGKFIRRTRFDELPQLINVLRGELTFIGPRPERPEIAAQYEKEFPEFKYRLRVKAGLTGYSQVVGRYNTTPRDKLLLDLHYIKHCSILMDFEILLMTAKILILPESTQGVEQVTALVEKDETK